MIANILIAFGFFSLGFICGALYAIDKTKKTDLKENDLKQIIICIDKELYADKD